MAQTHTDTNVNQLVINKMTKQEYDNLSQVSETELYLVEEQVDSVVTQNSTNPVQSGAVYEALQQSSSNIKEIVDNLIISNNLAYPLEGTYIGQVGYTEPPMFYDRKAADFHTFVSQDNGKYFYDDIDNKVYIYIEKPNQHLYCVSDNELYYLENLDTTKTYLSYKTDKLYRTNNGENFNLIATTDYIDLKNKPLSVENSKVKYTLLDGTTKLTLAQESDVKDIGITFTSDTVSGNIASGETLAVMMKKINIALGMVNINNDDWTVTEYIRDSNLYGILNKTLGILMICGWFRVVNTDIPRYAKLFKLKGYSGHSCYPLFAAEELTNGERHTLRTRTGESGYDGYFLFVNRTSTSNSIYFEGLPNVLIVEKD